MSLLNDAYRAQVASEVAEHKTQIERKIADLDAQATQRVTQLGQIRALIADDERFDETDIADIDGIVAGLKVKAEELNTKIQAI